MPKNKKPSEKYVRILDKFGLLPQFDFTKKERKIVKYLGKVGPKDLLDIGDALDYKPEKVRKLVDRLIGKGAVIENGNVVELTPIALQYITTIKHEKKSAKTFYRFVDTLSEKELDEFMKLISSFKVAPKEAPIEEIKEILEEPKEAPEEEDDRPIHQRLFSSQEEPCVMPMPPEKEELDAPAAEEAEQAEEKKPDVAEEQAAEPAAEEEKKEEGSEDK